ncbi:adenosine deaminase [Paenibacillus endoradicis]|uniref:adenosine deaminase n=1 Tax=Paenibacillus endoradicis TaxID=2972487 RepID=UPI00215901F7|nr:adenosine deaminase [Paenibacillus endoradicis]MCR8656359.1 adenosine deaminase [Paenibacillus endoradicis]
MTLTYEQLQQMPKVELHLHLDGSILPATLIELASQQNMSLPTTDVSQLLSYMIVPAQCEDLNQYLSTFDFVLPFTQTANALERIAYEVVQQCAEQNVRYVEVRFAPQLHVNKGLTVADTYRHVIAGLQRGEQQFNVVARCIGICLRGHSAEHNMEVVEEAAAFINKGLVAVDLAGAEAMYPPMLYRDIFDKAQHLNLPITIHAGEAGGAQNVDVSVHELGATRIGHGVRIQEDSNIFNDINNLQIPLEFCPISNLQTKAIESWEKYPLVHYLNSGIIVTVNTDNLTVSNTNLTKELWTLQHKLSLSLEQLLQLQYNATHAVFLEQSLKVAFIEKMEEELKCWKAKFGH